MRTYLSKHFGDAMGRILSKVEFEEDVHPRDPRGRFAPKEGGGVAEWMSGRDDRDVQRQARLETDRKTAIEKVGALIGKPITTKVEFWDQLSPERQIEVEDKFVEDRTKTYLKTRIKDGVKEDIVAIGRKVLAEIGFPADKMGLVIDEDIKTASEMYNRTRQFSQTIQLVTGMKKDEADRYSEDFFGKLDFAVEEEVKRRTNSEEGVKAKLSLENDTRLEWGSLTKYSRLSIAKKFDLNEDMIVLREPKAYKLTEDGQDYTDTGSLGNALAAERFKEIIKERRIDQPDPKFIEDLWLNWKHSSTSELGLVLQHAAARELGANSRLHQSWVDKMDTETIDQVRAYVRAQWETSQFLMHKAGVDEIPVYRAVFLPGNQIGSKKQEVSEEPAFSMLSSRQQQPLPDLRLQQNGVSSWTAQREVANEWGGIGSVPEGHERVVLRARIPSTAVFSLPVHGKNVESEQEVVVAGTPWKAWDAWRHDAPEFGRVPLEKERGLLTQAKAEGKGFVIDLNDPKITAGTKYWLTQKQASNPKPKKG